LIRTAGINSVKAFFIISMAKTCMEKHNGRLPNSYADLTAMKGIGRKTAVLFMNECYGFPYGVGADSHVFELSKTWGFLHQGPKPQAIVTPEDAENALREWVPCSDYKKTNKIFGTFGQLFSQDLEVVATDEQRQLAYKVLRALDDYVGKPYQIEIFWFLLKKARQQYRCGQKK
jgi:endonuclease III